jgi:hypothetical protein
MFFCFERGLHLVCRILDHWFSSDRIWSGFSGMFGLFGVFSGLDLLVFSGIRWILFGFSGMFGFLGFSVGLDLLWFFKGFVGSLVVQRSDNLRFSRIVGCSRFLSDLDIC